MTWKQAWMLQVQFSSLGKELYIDQSSYPQEILHSIHETFPK